MIPPELRDFLHLALAEQGRGPDCPHPEHAFANDFDTDCLGKSVRFLQPGIGRATPAFTRQLRNDDNRALTSGDVGFAMTVIFAQGSSSCCSPSSLSGRAGCRVEIACL